MDEFASPRGQEVPEPAGLEAAASSPPARAAVATRSDAQERLARLRERVLARVAAAQDGGSGAAGFPGRRRAAPSARAAR